VLQASEEPGGVLSGIMRSDGSGGDVLSIPAGGSVHPATAETIRDGLHYIQMNGREVFRFATRVMAQATHQAIDKAGLTLDDIKTIIPHQANKRIIEAAARGLKLPIERFVINVDRYGNTSTASIPIATVEAIEEGRLEEGDNIVFVGFGGGLTWGSMAVQWTGSLPAETRIHPTRVRTLARLRSWLLRLARRIEGLIWGRTGYRRRKK
jgi:3-oxoacyl-[acyl-carrier-protein] synthase-3